MLANKRGSLCQHVTNPVLAPNRVFEHLAFLTPCPESSAKLTSPCAQRIFEVDIQSVHEDSLAMRSRGIPACELKQQVGDLGGQPNPAAVDLEHLGLGVELRVPAPEGESFPSRGFCGGRQFGCRHRGPCSVGLWFSVV